MGDLASTIPTPNSEEHVIAAAQHILKALGDLNLDDNTRRLLSDLDIQLSTLTKVRVNNGRRTREVEERLNLAQKKVLRWESNRSMIWASGQEGASEYLQAVHEIQRLTESLTCLLSCRSGKQKELLDQAQAVLHMAMERLKEELIYILARNEHFFELEHVSFRSCEDGFVCDVSIASTEDDSVEETSQRRSDGSEYEEPVLDLIHPNAMPDIKSIANIMFASQYDREFCHAFVDFWKDSLDKYFSHLGIENFSVEDLLRMEWKSMNCKVKKWIWAMKFIVQVYLSSEKRLFDQVLGDLGSAHSSFIEATNSWMMCLLKFGEAMVIAPRRPEKLFSLLDMYEVLSSLIQDIDSLFSYEEGFFIRTEFYELLLRLGDTAKATFLELGIAVASSSSGSPFPGGGIHHLTKYVMNYINPIFEYTNTLNLLLESENNSTPSPLALHLRLLTFNLESNLDQKSRLYRDPALKHIFMMNNIHYMVQKVNGSELKTFFGDEWIRNYTAKFQQHATSYERVTWNPILSLLRDDGKLGKSTLKQRCKVFGTAFDDVYKSQTGWFICDPELRKDLRVSISQKVIHAYRPFISKVSAIIRDKHVKYSADDLDNYICDLFEGSSRSLHQVRKK